VRNADLLQDAVDLTSRELRLLDQAQAVTVAGLRLRSQKVFGPGRLTQPDQWSWLGPRNVGGRTRAIAFDPADPDRVWAGSVAGGLWVNSRNVNHVWEGWRIVDASLACFAVSALAIAPKSKAIYVGTGEYIGDRVGVVNANRESGVRGSGVFRGVGRTWETMTWSEITDNKCDDFDFVNRLALAERDDQTILLAATSTGLFRSTVVANQVRQWNKVDAGPGGFGDVEFHPTDFTRAVAATFTSGQGEDGKALVSTDAGRTWTEATHPGWRWRGRIDLAYARANPELVYASVAACAAGEKPYLGMIFRSADGGRTYQPRTSSLCPPGNPDCGQGNDFLFGNGDYCNAIWAGDPDDPRFLLVGGPELRRSRDGGDTLEPVPARGLNLLEENFSDHHAIVAAPGYRPGAASVFVVNDGGVYMSSDIRDPGTAKAPGPAWTPFNGGYGTVHGPRSSVRVAPCGPAVAAGIEIFTSCGPRLVAASNQR
jgi:hypothetical protein